MKQLAILAAATTAIVIFVSELLPWIGDQDPAFLKSAGGPMAGFVNSIIITVAFTLAVIIYAKQRPVGTPVTWGEAMVGATFAFMFFTLGYGIVPDRWIIYASELGWDDPARLVRDDAVAPIDWIANLFPFDINYIHIRDLIVVGIYGIAIGVNIWIWLYWQNRGATKTEVEPVSEFGRPLVKES
ncbi:MAG: hypothetical protein AAGA17_01650 [Actinomycetota bacterium]